MTVTVTMILTHTVTGVPVNDTGTIQSTSRWQSGPAPTRFKDGTDDDDDDDIPFQDGSDDDDILFQDGTDDDDDDSPFQDSTDDDDYDIHNDDRGTGS